MHSSNKAASSHRIGWAIAWAAVIPGSAIAAWFQWHRMTDYHGYPDFIDSHRGLAVLAAALFIIGYTAMVYACRSGDEVRL